MASFKIEELRAGDTTVSEPLQTKNQGGRKKAMGEKGYQDHRSREDTEKLIKSFLQEKGSSTVTTIARALGRTASPHFRRIVLEMAEAGQLVETVDTVPNGFLARYWYSLPS